MILVNAPSSRHPLLLYLALGSFTFFAWTGAIKRLPQEGAFGLQSAISSTSTPLQVCFQPQRSSRRGVPRSTPFETFIHRAALDNRLDPRLFKAVIQAESEFNMYDISPAGACGLMQLMPRTARLLQVTDIFDPEQNIRAGAQH